MRHPMEWSTYQKRVFEEAARPSDTDTAVIARAGTGKTTAILESLNHLPTRSVLLCAFNKSIQTEMESRAPSHVTCRTLHSLGLRVHQQALRHRGVRAQVVPEKGKELAEDVLKHARYGSMLQGTDLWGKAAGLRYLREATGKVVRLAGYAKNTLVTKVDELRDLAIKMDLDDDPRYRPELLAQAAHEAMDRAADDYKRVDFDDMCWLPWIYGYTPDQGMVQFGTVMVDEAQDLNPVQLWLVRQMVRDRVFALLDPRQTLYSFRGADRRAVNKIVGASGNRLSLPISYRCPNLVVEKAKLIVPDIQAAPNARDGHVELLTYQEMLDQAKPGDFVLSRTNAPLMVTCLHLLARRVPACVAGQDIAGALLSLIDKSKATTTASLTRWLAGWFTSEQERHQDNPARLERSRDRVGCLRAVASYCDTVKQVRDQLGSMFTNRDDTDRVVCSTVHKAKGLERDRVYLLSKTFGYPDIQPWQDGWSEENIWYVGVTRSKHYLGFVETDVADIMGRAPTQRRRVVSWR